MYRPATRGCTLIDPLGHLFNLHYTFMRFSINPRFGSVRPYVSINDTNGGAGGELRAGVVTYHEKEDGTETYSITEVSGGARSDHAYDFIQERLGNKVEERLLCDDSTDVLQTGTIEQNETVRNKDAESKDAPALEAAAA